jgi:hypothetical protein
LQLNLLQNYLAAGATGFRAGVLLLAGAGGGGAGMPLLVL